MRSCTSFIKIVNAFAISLSLGLGPVADAMADGYTECNQILTQDIFNRLIKNDSSDQASAEETLNRLFMSDATDAYEVYEKEYRRASEEARKKGTKISIGGNYGPIGAQLGLDLTSEHKVSKEDFEKQFNSVKQSRKQTKESLESSKSSSSQSFVNSYASYVRDAGTVEAWKDCVTKTKETNLYAFAKRDKAGKTYVDVIWVPGALVGSVPGIPISFETDDDIKINAKTEHLYLATGSGRSYLVECRKKSCDDGFLVTVNGTVKNAAGVATSSFTTNVEVPPKQPVASPTVSIRQVAGTWEIHQTGGSPEHLGTLTLIQEGRRLRGTLDWKTPGLEPSAEIVDGQISGEQVTIMVRYPKSKVEGTYVGSLESPNRLSGTARGQGGTAGWHATR